MLGDPQEQVEGHRADVWFAGVQVRFQSERPLDIGGLPVECQAPVERAGAGLEVQCQLAHQRDRVPGHAAGPTSVHWTWRGETARVRAGSIQGAIRRRGQQLFEAKLSGGSGSGADNLAAVVAYPLIDLEGGFVLHAAGASLPDGRAVLFVGRSGAGKTTAVGLTGLPLFAVDRAAVVPGTDGTWMAYSLPGGTAPPPGIARSPLRMASLAAVLTVEQAQSHPAVLGRAPEQALAALRAASLWSRGLHHELRLLDRLQALIGQVPVGTARTVLNAPLLPALAKWLASREGERRGSA